MAAPVLKCCGLLDVHLMGVSPNFCHAQPALCGGESVDLNAQQIWHPMICAWTLLVFFVQWERQSKAVTLSSKSSLLRQKKVLSWKGTVIPFTRFSLH